jgi:5'-3' exonuclease
MGVKGLTAFLRFYKRGALFRNVTINEFRGQTLAVDANEQLHFCWRMDQQNFVNIMINHAKMLRKNDINPIYVLDGGPVDLKNMEISQRQQQKKTNIEKEANLTKESSKKLEDILAKQATHDTLESALYDPLLNAEEKKQKAKQVQKIEAAIKKDKKKLEELENESNKVKIAIGFDKKQAFKMLRNSLVDLNFEVVQAIGDSEKECTRLVKTGKAHIVASNDGDAFTFGAPVIVRDIIPSDVVHQTHMYKLEDVIQSLGENWSMDMFVDFCILCGGDFLRTKEEVKPLEARALIQKFKTIENIIESKELIRNEFGDDYLRMVALVRRYYTDPDFYGKIKIKNKNT